MSTNPGDLGPDGESLDGVRKRSRDELLEQASSHDPEQSDPFQDAERLAARLPGEQELRPGAENLPSDDEAGLVPGWGPDGPLPSAPRTGDAESSVTSEEERFDAG